MNEHSHCHICGRMTSVGETLCGAKACQEKHDEAQAIKKRSVYLLVALIAAAILLSKFVQF